MAYGMRTTPPPPLDITGYFPELRLLARRTVRLHPRRDVEPGLGDSKLGGTILWPVSEPWPVCTVGHVDSEPQHSQDEQLLLQEWRMGGSHLLGNHPDWRPVGQPHGAYVGVIQLRAADVPELGFPDGCDLFQLLWCPRDHLPHYSPQVRTYWRQTANLSAALQDIPVPTVFDPQYMPRVCSFAPERVREYPDIRDLSDDLRRRIWEWEDTEAAQGYSYQHNLSVAPGTKVGGHVGWTQDSEVPCCASCQQEMEYLLTIASVEWDGESGRTWRPLEESSLTFEASVVDERLATQEATGLVLGDADDLMVFICRRCPGWPVASVHQCS